jgi:hypothetical protein
MEPKGKCHYLQDVGRDFFMAAHAYILLCLFTGYRRSLLKILYRIIRHGNSEVLHWSLVHECFLVSLPAVSVRLFPIELTTYDCFG